MYLFGGRGTVRTRFLFVEGTGLMREQGSLKSKGEGTHRGNLFVKIFKQKLSSKDIIRIKAKNKCHCLFAF